MSQSEKDGHTLDMICVEFLSSHAAMGTVADYLKHVEHVTGLQLLAYDAKGGDNKDGEIVYGDDLLDTLSSEEDEDEEEGDGGEASA